MKKVIVSGANGFIASRLVPQLVADGVFVYALVRNPAVAQSIRSELVCPVVCKLGDYDRLPELIADRDIDVMYHFAWQGVSNADARDPDVQLRNVRASLEAVTAAKAMGIRRFIGAGSLHESEALTELDTGKPIVNMGLMYKTAKLAAHCMCKAAAGSMGIEFLWPIITNAYGAGENSRRLVNSLVRALLAGESPGTSAGKQLYDFVHVSDVARAFYLLGDLGRDGENYVIGSGTARPLRDYLEMLNAIVNPSVSIAYGKIASNVVFLPPEAFDVSTLTRDTSFVPEISFDRGIRDMCAKQSGTV